MGTARTSIIKKNYIWEKINKQSSFGLGYSEEKLICEFILDCNTSRKTALELLKAFETAERIIRREGKIYSKGYFNDDLTIKELSNEEESILTS
jgi:hypothetical protein